MYCFDALAEGTCKLLILGELSAQPDSFLIILRTKSQETHCQRFVAAECSGSVSVQKRIPIKLEAANKICVRTGQLRFVVQVAWGLAASQALLAFFYFFIKLQLQLHFDHISCAENVAS